MTLTSPEPRWLQHQLDEITANTRALVPSERLVHIEQVISDLRSTGIESRILGLSSDAPPFSLTGANGKRVRSEDLLALGSLVIKFFRGRWDPYDMTELEAWQALVPDLRAHNALLVAISPQTPRQNGFTADRHNFTFPILSDPTAALAEQFGLTYTVPDATRAYYRSILVNIPFLNGDETWRLPLPATIVLNPAGKVLFSEAHADHRIRPEPSDVLSVLEQALPVLR